MESSYNVNKDQNQKLQSDKKQEQIQIHQREGPSPALSRGVGLIQSGAKLRDLSPKEAREIAGVIGNQAVMNLLRGGTSVKLAQAPPGRAKEVTTLPETAVDIRWPALTVQPKLIRNGPMPNGVFAIENLRQMGQYGEQGVPPDG